MTHPQADILRAIADGKVVQARYVPGEWFDAEPSKALGFIAAACDSCEVRIKPETMTLAGHEFPEPVRKSLKYGTPYFMVSVGDAPYTEHKWRGHQHDHRGLQHGLIQITAEGAIAQAKAMIAAVGGEV